MNTLIVVTIETINKYISSLSFINNINFKVLAEETGIGKQQLKKCQIIQPVVLDGVRNLQMYKHHWAMINLAIVGDLGKYSKYLN